jgi:hypothetical protein
LADEKEDFNSDYLSSDFQTWADALSERFEKDIALLSPFLETYPVPALCHVCLRELSNGFCGYCYNSPMSNSDDDEEESIGSPVSMDTSENLIEKQPTLMELDDNSNPLSQSSYFCNSDQMDLDTPALIRDAYPTIRTPEHSNSKKRKLNASYDLVGIESNPGPPAKKKQKMTKMGKNVGKVGQLVVQKSTGARARPGVNPNPRSMTMGISHLVEYMRNLNNPFDYPPARPGVGCAVPTGLFSCYFRGTFAGIPSTGISLVFLPNRLQFPVMLSTSAASTYTYGPWSAISQFPQYPAVTALYEKARLLSGGVRLIPTTNSTNDGGQISSALVPSVRVADVNAFGQITSTTATQGFNEYPNYPETLVTPFRDGSTVFWRPQDPNSFVFKESILTDNATASASSSFSQETLQGQPFIVFGINGTTTGASCVFEFIAHYEGTIAAGNAGVIELKRSPPTNDGTAIAAADKVFGYGNRTSVPGYVKGYRDSMAAPKRGGGGSDWLATLGSSVIPIGASILKALL